MLIHINCGAVYFKGEITGMGGEPVNGKTVRLRGLDRPYYKISGEGESPGKWGFSPLAPNHFHSPFTLYVDLVESEANPQPISDAKRIDFAGCEYGGEFVNIIFAWAR